MTENTAEPEGDQITNPETIEAMEAARAGDLVKVGGPDRLLESLNAAQPPDVKAHSE